jgi:VWFA-related protein
VKRHIQLAWLLAAVLVLGAPATWGQAPAGPLHPNPGAPPESPRPAQKVRAAVRVRVNLVNTPVTVSDDKGELVLDLTEKDFHVFDNGVEQQITHFDLGGDPLAVALVVETSSRIEALLPAVRRTGIVFTQTVMAQTADAAVIGYDDTVTLLQRFTSSQDTVQKTIDNLREGTSGARLYDALSRAITLLREQPASQRRIIVIMGEATDTGSEEKLGSVLREAQLANIAIYSVGLSTTAAELRAKPSQAAPPQIGPPGTFPLPPIPGVPQTPTTQQQQMGNIDLLSAIIWLVKTGANAVGPNTLAMASKATGGLHVNTFKDRSVENALDEIGGELHAQYSLSYRPPGDEPSGYHEIKVNVSRPKVQVRTRPGYYIPPPTS